METTPPIRVMIIDDEPQMTELLKLIVKESMKCTVTTYNDPVVAYQHLQAEPFDVISLDHRMPKMTGVGMLELLRAGAGPNQNTPVLIFTGFLDEAENVKTAALGNVLFLEKPIDDERYLRILKIALQMNRKAAPSAA
jgi:DNA-binding NtrC family response regulator